MTKVGILVGSLRKESYSRRVAQNMAMMFPNEVTLEWLKISALPLFNEDLEAEGVPEWESFKRQVANVDGLLIVTPEYNRSLPGGLKNALDVGSRSATGPVWQNKPALIISDSVGGMGGFGASQHLKQIALAVGMRVLQPTEIYLGHAAQLFDSSGLLKAQQTSYLLNQAVNQLVKTISQQVSCTFELFSEKINAVDVTGQTMGYGDFSINGSQLTIDEVAVAASYRGRGVAIQLVLKLILVANEFGLKIVPICPYAVKFFKDHPEFKIVSGAK